MPKHAKQLRLAQVPASGEAAAIGRQVERLAEASQKQAKAERAAADRTPPSVVARVDRSERWRTNTRWGDLSASQLGAVMEAARRGDIADFCELVEFAISTDEHLQ